MYRIILAAVFVFLSIVSSTVGQPVILNCPGLISKSHCDISQYSLLADPNGGDAVHFALVSGPAVIDPNTGGWQLFPWYVGTDTLVIRAYNSSGSDTCTIELDITNDKSEITCPTDTTVCANDQWNYVDVNGIDDCDVIWYTLIDSGGVTGQVVFNDATGFIRYRPSDADALLPQPITMKVTATDMYEATDTCSVHWRIREPVPYRVKIDLRHDAIPGQIFTLGISLSGADSVLARGLSGFDFLIAYDNTLLNLQTAEPGELFVQCEWEYFAYQIDSTSCSGDNCPSGLVRIAGIWNLGAPITTPPCNVPNDPIQMVKLKFVEDAGGCDECGFRPIRFFWLGCGDNALVSTDLTEAYISADVFNYDGTTSITNDSIGFPTYLGAQRECTDFPSVSVRRSIDFVNGGIDFVCPDSLSFRGDFNCNGMAFETVDAMRFADYFTIGPAAFGTDTFCIWSASDVNCDGLHFGIDDFMGEIATLLGEPYDFENGPVSGYCYIYDHGMLFFPGVTVGAVAVTVEGNVSPALLFEDYVLEYMFDGTNTKIIAYPAIDPYRPLNRQQGAILNLHGAHLISVEAARTDARRLLLNPTSVDEGEDLLPTEFSLSQNYPNPFNPVTAISFALPEAADVRLEIYNVAGQRVRKLVDEPRAAGRYTVGWDGRDEGGRIVASGVYMYRLTAGNFAETKRMLLVK